MPRVQDSGYFCITGGKGFHITFENGWTVSVQFGLGNYCDNYRVPMGDDWEETQHQCGEKGSTTAECAVWGPDHKMRKYRGWGDVVSNRSSPAEVLRVMRWAARQPEAESQ